MSETTSNFRFRTKNLIFHPKKSDKVLFFFLNFEIKYDTFMNIFIFIDILMIESQSWFQGM